MPAMRGPSKAWVFKVMLDVVFCTNLVNYMIAKEGVLRERVRPTLLIYDAARLSAPEVSLPGVLVLSLRRWVTVSLSMIARLGGLGTVYLPHHSVNRHVLALSRLARRTALLDDGLDTHRVVPKNVVPAQISAGTEYLTFDEFEAPAPWMSALKVRRVCPLGKLASRAGAHIPKLERIRHVLFESPGLDAAALIKALSLNPEETLLIEHPVALKQSRYSGPIKRVRGAEINSEALLDSVLEMDLYFGETMLLFYAVARSHSSNRIHVQMRPEQQANLVGLRLDPEPSTVLGLGLCLARRGVCPNSQVLSA